MRQRMERVRSLLLLTAALAAGPAGSAAAQLAVQQPTEKLLIVPVPVASGADSATSLRVMDLTRERVDRLARYKVLVISKQKICEALQASGFSCDGLMDAQQARQLARFLDADAFLTGVVHKEGGVLGARLRVVDVGGSGFAYSFSANDANPGTADALGEAIAQRLNAIIRAAERARDCDEQRRRGAFPRAIETARKALEADPNLPSAHLCMATVYEAQRLGPDSMIAAASRALKGDSLNTHALELMFRQSQVKGDTGTALDWAERLFRADPSNKSILMGIVTQRQLRKEYEPAERILRWAIEQSPGDQQLVDRLYQVCIEGGRWRCVLDVVNEKVTRDSTLLGDTATLKVAIGAAQQIPDTQALDRYTGEAVRRYPADVSFLKTRGNAFELRGQADSAIAYYTRAYRADTADVANALLVAKTIIEAAVWDTTKADSMVMVARRRALAQRLETVRPFVARGLSSRDTAYRVNSVALMFTAGAKLAQAAAYEPAYPWLDTLLQNVEEEAGIPNTPGIQQIRTNGSFWYGVSSVVTSQALYKAMTQSKSCSEARSFNDRVKRTRAALERSRQVHAQTVEQMLKAVVQFENAMKSVKQAFKCTNF
jgi:tetratricopeptide (TPR) repeat protein